MSLIVDGTSGVTFNDSSLQGAAASPFGLKNRIINGDMVVDQRNNGATTSTTNGYTLDRFYFYSDISGISTTVQRVSDAPTGFVNSLRVTAVTGATAGAGRQSVIGQSIEGFNVADLGWGTANARTITISFWVKSSLTGTFAGNLQNAAPNRDYVFTYTISAANTWEYKTVTISGDTTGTWGTTNGVGISVYFNMGSNQSSFAGTANTWSSSIFRTVTGATELLQTTGATWQITGVQLERNTTATPFEWIPYTTELQLCQRYFWKPNNAFLMQGITSNRVATNIFYPAQMRATPTLSLSTTTPYWESVPWNVAGSITSGSADGSKLTSTGGPMSFTGTFGTTPVQSYPGLFGTGTEITFSSEL